MFQGFKITKLQSHLVLMLLKENIESFHNCVGLMFRRFNVALQKCQNLLKLLCLKCVLLQCWGALPICRFNNASLQCCFASPLHRFTTASLHQCIATPLHRITTSSLQRHAVSSTTDPINLMKEIETSMSFKNDLLLPVWTS